MKISVSSLPYNDNIIEKLPEIVNSGADFLHLDIMDGSLTENKTFLDDTVNIINNKTTLFLDCHLMIDEPFSVVENYVKSGVNIVSIHYEAFNNKKELIKTLKFLKNKKVIVGLAIYPNTKVEEILPYKDYFDLILIMSVEIGKYGQKFIESSLEKIKIARKIFPNKLIEVDGGINLENIAKIKEAGADIAVAGSSFYKSEDKIEFIKKIKIIIDNV